MRIVLAIVMSLALVACAKAPQENADVPATPAGATDVPADAPEVLPPPELADDTAADDADAVVDDAGAAGAPPAADDDTPPANTIAVGEPNPGAPGSVDTSCRTDADCAVKDVGSCCGYRPACVAADSPTFPKEVQAQCAKDGRMGICGFPAITGCTCRAGKCEGTGADAAEIVH
jgi:hypothetical protein